MCAPKDRVTKIGTSFHQTYSLNRLGIAAIMRAIDVSCRSAGEHTRIRASTVHEHTTLSNRHFNALLGYAVGCNLITRNLGFTHFGRLTQRHDPEFNLPSTQWIMHYHLCRVVGENPVFWRSLVVDWLCASASLEAVEGLQVLLQSSKKEIAETSLRRALTVFVSSYDSFEGLYQLALVKRQQGGITAAHRSNIPDRVLLYALVDHWENNWQERQSVNLSAVMSNDGPLGVILMHADEITLALRRLELASMLEFQRNVPPFQIFKRWTTVEAVLDSVFAQQPRQRRRTIRSRSMSGKKNISEQTE